MNQINAGEIFYQVAKQNLSPDPDRFWNWFLQLPIAFLSNDFDLVTDAARIKARYPISYDDAFAVATAQREQATIISTLPKRVSIFF